MQAYSDPSRESDPHALSDVEVFYVHALPRKAYDRIYAEPDTAFAGCEPGWYYWFYFPGCLPDSDPIGPFKTSDEALAEAQSDE